ncbi:N-acetylmuramoyl-L-alanine amidase [Desulfitispora alkaliphila]|uniref:cell wall hydrolase n=1 Tax=Desulfitispora alkaliphila TaxID=622674 RepID=UPI003D1DE4D9
MSYFKFLFTGLAVLGLVFIGQPDSHANQGTNHQIRWGESLFLIGKQYGVSVEDIKKANGLSGDMILAGKSIIIPNVHTVQKGESLFLISRDYGTTVNALKSANNLTSDEILVGQRLTIPDGARQQAAPVASRGANTTANTNSNFTEEDVYWLARMIHAEARGESYEGQVAVGAVILNRVKHADYPNTIYDVLFQVTNGRNYQFSPVLDGAIWQEPNETAFRAARDAINGWDPSGGAIFFYNPVTSTNQWIFSRPIITQIGRHVFAR